VHADVIHPRELHAEQAARWRALQQRDPLLGSPFLGPSFAQVVGAERPDARVAVLNDGAGFFAFHHGRGRTGAPLGRTLADYQGVVSEPDLAWTAEQLTHACGLRSYAFDHVIAAQPQWQPAIRVREPSPVVDLVRFDPEKDMPRESRQKARRLARDGEPRFVWHEPGAAALATLVRWKRQQYARTGVYDIFDHAWVPALVRRLHAAAEPDLAGVLACLYDGEDLIAAQLALLAGSVMHLWMPAYDPARADQSPGLVLQREILLEAPARGVTIVDFGKGTDGYKGRFANDTIEVGAGSVQSAAPWRAAAAAARASLQAVNRTRLQGRAYRAQRRVQVG
jgi:CelD/BcsL family acetyltransferase involved in cellulose biosynthesis